MRVRPWLAAVSAIACVFATTCRTNSWRLLVGAVNGYLVVGHPALTARVSADSGGLDPNFPRTLPISDAVIIRTEQIESISQYLPIPLLTSNPFFCRYCSS